MKFGFEAYTWQMSSDACIGQIDRIARIVSECGGEGIEPEISMLGHYTDEPAKFRELLDTHGLSLAAICYVEDWRHEAETGDETRGAEKVIDFISRFPGSLLQLCPRSGSNREGIHERQLNAIRCMNNVARRAADRGVFCVVHPSSSPGSVFRTRDEYQLLLNGLDSSTIGFAPDTGHILRGGMDPLETIRAYCQRVRHVHARDVSATGEWAEMGKGAVDFPAIISYLAEIDYSGWVIVDDESARALSDPDEAARRNAAYVHNNLPTLLRSPSSAPEWRSR